LNVDHASRGRNRKRGAAAAATAQYTDITARSAAAPTTATAVEAAAAPTGAVGACDGWIGFPGRTAGALLPG
jgi:hypothetical protein